LGTKLDYIHPPRNPNGALPCRHADQNAHAVVVPRTISPMKAKAYSTTFQMHEMRGSYLGLDTMSLADYGRYDFQSIIAKQNELLSYAGRMDVRGLMRRHAATGIIPAWLAEDYDTNAEIERLVNTSLTGEMLPGSSWKKCSEGSTYVSYPDAIRLQKCLDNDGVNECIICDDARILDNARFQDIDNVCSVPLKAVWPTEIVWTQKTDSYGCSFPPVPPYKVPGVDTRYLWITMCFLSSVPPFWKATAESVKRTSQWPGWVLARAVKDCFVKLGRKDLKSNPFKLKTTIKTVNGKMAGLDPRIFSLDTMHSQLSVVENVDTVWSTDIFTGTFVENGNRSMISLTKPTIVVIRRDDDDESVLPQELWSHDCSCHWELRCVTNTQTGEEPHKWKGSCLVRHGGKQYTGWWKHSRGSRAGSKFRNVSLDRNNLASWDFAVFVQTEDIDFGVLSDAYLGYIGGQPSNYCGVHNKPLIAAINTKGSRTRCTCKNTDDSVSGPCGRTGYLCCTELGCAVTVCRIHVVPAREPKQLFGLYSASNDNTQSSSADVEMQYEPYRNVNDNESQDHSSNMSESVSTGEDSNMRSLSLSDEMDDYNTELEPSAVGVDLPAALLGNNQAEHVISRALQNDFGSTSGSDSVASEELSGLRDPVFSQATVDTDMECTRAAIVDDAIDPEELNENVVNSDDNGYTLLHTNSARKVVPIWCAKTFISGHIVLNGVGNCLIRRNRPIRPRRYQSAFLEKIVCTSDGHAVPLVYPEGMMFTSLFWKDVFDGSLVGAIPSALLTDARQCSRNGFASVTDHMKARIKNPSLLTSTDPRYVFHAFDCFANINLRGEDSRLILSRGFVERQSSGGVRANRSEYFNTDSIDSRPVVNKLSAAVAEETPTYFYTQSCNQKEFYGVQELKRWIDSPELKEQLLLAHPHASADELLELHDAITQASCVATVRNWMEVAEIHMQYISKSPEQPFGNVTKIWWRHEFQGDRGNLSHIHSLLWTDDNDEAVILDRIRGSVAELIRQDEIHPLIAEGYFKDINDIHQIRDNARRFLFHHCDQRCLRRTGPGEDDFKCRVPSAILLNPVYTEHSRVVIEPHHSGAALDVLRDLNICHEESTTDHFMPLDDRFLSERCYPPAMPGEGTMSPTNGRLFAYTGSQSNCQRTTGYFSSRYLAKYVAGLDENNVVYVAPGNCHAGSGDHHITPELVLHTEIYHASKVTGSKINIEK